MDEIAGLVVPAQYDTGTLSPPPELVLLRSYAALTDTTVAPVVGRAGCIDVSIESGMLNRHIGTQPDLSALRISPFEKHRYGLLGGSNQGHNGPEGLIVVLSDTSGLDHMILEAAHRVVTEGIAGLSSLKITTQSDQGRELWIRYFVSPPVREERRTLAGCAILSAVETVTTAKVAEEGSLKLSLGQLYASARLVAESGGILFGHPTDIFTQLPNLASLEGIDDAPPRLLLDFRLVFTLLPQDDALAYIDDFYELLKG